MSLFQWPDPLEPNIVTRDLTVLRSEEKKGRKRRKRLPPLPLRGVKLIELIPYCLYEVPVDCHADAAGVRELRPGSVLSRNMKLSERLNGGPVDAQVNQIFQSFDGVFKARRGLGKIDRRYHSREIPAGKQLKGTLEEMIKLSWELHKVDEDGREAFVLIAVRAAQTYAKAPIDEDKRKAKGRTLQAGKPMDSTGRFNPGRIPLICFAGENRIAARIQAVRGIGRRMSFREAVLEHYIDRLREVSRQVRDSQQYRLRDTWLGPGNARRPSKVRHEADQLDAAAQKLRAIVSRPFSRSFTNCARDLESAAQKLRAAAADRDPDKIAAAKQDIATVYRAMVQMECHWRIEEVLLQVSMLEDRKQADVAPSQQLAWHEELRAVHRRLTSVDKLTGKRLEHGFRRKVLPRVVPRVHLADVHLMRATSDGGPDIKTAGEELRLAVEPL